MMRRVAGGSGAAGSVRDADAGSECAEPPALLVKPLELPAESSADEDDDDDDDDDDEDDYFDGSNVAGLIMTPATAGVNEDLQNMRGGTGPTTPRVPWQGAAWRHQNELLGSREMFSREPSVRNLAMRTASHSQLLSLPSSSRPQSAHSPVVVSKSAGHASPSLAAAAGMWSQGQLPATRDREQALSPEAMGFIQLGASVHQGPSDSASPMPEPVPPASLGQFSPQRKPSLLRLDLDAASDAERVEDAQQPADELSLSPRSAQDVGCSPRDVPKSRGGATGNSYLLSIGTPSSPRSLRTSRNLNTELARSQRSRSVSRSRSRSNSKRLGREQSLSEMAARGASLTAKSTGVTLASPRLESYRQNVGVHPDGPPSGTSGWPAEAHGGGAPLQGNASNAAGATAAAGGQKKVMAHSIQPEPFMPFDAVHVMPSMDADGSTFEASKLAPDQLSSLRGVASPDRPTASKYVLAPDGESSPRGNPSVHAYSQNPDASAQRLSGMGGRLGSIRSPSHRHSSSNPVHGGSGRIFSPLSSGRLRMGGVSSAAASEAAKSGEDGEASGGNQKLGPLASLNASARGALDSLTGGSRRNTNENMTDAPTVSATAPGAARRDKDRNGPPEGAAQVSTSASTSSEASFLDGRFAQGVRKLFNKKGRK
ncbi:hypothetical protein FVE85_8825 [Porphyridium purpureum]|uniref:Uncharacterized protein n=1 Tax=Porphyridium purpureum TaxID=35688 RepID=A0A5J4YQW8_PORPP|nr:hypothetical protein FVE85_8825 [Porphyridium purpureum]|eukprot:POR0247..scf296_7